MAMQTPWWERFAIGDDVRVKVTGDVGQITQENGHAYKVCGIWLLGDEIEQIPFQTQPAGTTTVAESRSDCGSSDSGVVPTFLEHNVHVGGEGWQAEAIAALKDNGFLVLRGSALSDGTCHCCAKLAQARLESLIELARARGLDPDTGELRFKELCKRIKTDLRFDFPVPHINLAPVGVGELGKYDEADVAAWNTLYEEAHQAVWPVLQSLLDAMDIDGKSLVTKAGCVVAMPGARGQPFHPDGFVKGLFNVFLPLVPITPDNGPTQFQPGSQVLVDPDVVIPLQFAYSDSEVDPIAPCLAVGEVLIFDYRVTHRGMANTSMESRPVAYLTYCQQGVEDDYSFPDTSLFEV